MIKRLSIKNKKWAIILVIAAIIIPLLIFTAASLTRTASEGETVVPTKEPLPTFPDAPRVEAELIIRYSEGVEFDNLSSERQNEIMALFESYGVISQEKAYSEAKEGELSRSYLLKFVEGTDIDLAAQKIYEIQEVEGAQPNTEFGLF